WPDRIGGVLDHGFDVVGQAEIGAAVETAHAVTLQIRRYVCRLARRLQPVEDNVAAGRGEALRGGQTKTAERARDERALASQLPRLHDVVWYPDRKERRL